MPEMDGYEVCTILKKNLKTRHIPIILLTAMKSDPESRIKGLELGADAFLTKPIDEAELTAQINVMLRIKKSEDLLRAERDKLEDQVTQKTIDLTKSKQDLKAEREYIRTLHEASPAYFLAVEPSGTIRTMNHSLMQALNIRDDHNVSQYKLNNIIENNDVELMQEHFNHLLQGKQFDAIVCNVKITNNEQMTVEWKARPFIVNDAIEYIFFAGIDVTHRKDLEKIAARSNEQERAKIGQNLHDGLGQLLAGIIFKTEILKLKYKNHNYPPEENIVQLDEIITLVQSAISTTRNIAKGLFPVDVKGGGLISAIEQLCKEMKERNNIECILQQEGDIAIEDQEDASNIFYIIQEAINNSFKHGAAKHIIISIIQKDTSLKITVRDDGKGFSYNSVSQRDNKGTGLSIMQYRTWLLGGSLHIDSDSAGGTLISLTIKYSDTHQSVSEDIFEHAKFGAKKNTNTYKVLVVDDHPIVRQGLAQIINQEKDLTVCCEAKNADEALQRVAKELPDIVTVDISLEGASGMDLIKALRSRYPELPALVLSIYDESIYAERAISVGARGYVMKQKSPTAIIGAIHTILHGKMAFSEEIKERFFNKFQYEGREIKKHSIDALTNREFEIFQLIGQGMGNKHIADKLSISNKTVENYRERIKNKLNLPSSQDVVQFAVQWYHHHKSE